jgi:putative DNA primase/helicase
METSQAQVEAEMKTEAKAEILSEKKDPPEYRYQLSKMPEMDPKTEAMWNEGFSKYLKTNPFHVKPDSLPKYESNEEPHLDEPSMDLDEREMIIIKDMKLTDAGIAEAFNKLYGEDFRFMQDPNDAYRSVQKGKWISYNSCKWETIAEAEIRSMILGIIRTKESILLYQTSGNYEQGKIRRKMLDRCLSFEQDVKEFGVLNQIKTQTYILSDRFDQDDWLLGCKNAVIDLRKGLPRSSIDESTGQPAKNYVFKATSVEYDPMAECPRWIKFLDEIFLGNKELIDYIHMVIGYTLTGSQDEQCFFILYGDAENGKSTFLEVILKSMGDYGQSAEFKTFCEKREENISNEVWRMQDKRFIRAVEIKKTVPLNVARIQSMTGKETMTSRQLYHEAVDFRFKGKIFLGVNHPPLIAEMDRAIERRIHLIPFQAHFPKGSPQRDDQLLEKLLAEKSGILNWAIMGCLQYQWARDKFGSIPVPEIVRLETSEYVMTQDKIRRFLEEMTEVKRDEEVGAMDLYEAFLKWCERKNENQIDQHTFGRRLTSLGYQKKKTNQGIVYKNLKVKASIIMWDERVSA